MRCSSGSVQVRPDERRVVPFEKVLRRPCLSRRLINGSWDPLAVSAPASRVALTHSDDYVERPNRCIGSASVRDQNNQIMSSSTADEK